MVASFKDKTSNIGLLIPLKEPSVKEKDSKQIKEGLT